MKDLEINFYIRDFSVKGGAERILAEVATSFLRSGWKVSIVSCEGRSLPTAYPVDESIAVIRPKLNMQSKWLYWLFLLYRLWRSRDCAFSIGFMASSYCILGAIGSWFPQRYFGCEHIGINYYEKRLCQRVALKHFTRGLLGLGTVQMSLARDLQVSVSCPVSVLPNFISDQFCRSNRSEVKSFQVLAVMRLEPQKDPMILIDAFTLVIDMVPHARLKIIGSGSMYHEIKKSVDVDGLANHVDLVQHSDNLMEEYQAAVVTVLPSKFESFGLVLGESIAAGTPVIVFNDCIGLPPFLEENVNCYYVAEGQRSASGLASVIVDCLHRLNANDCCVEANEKISASIKGYVGFASVERYWHDFLGISSDAGN